MAHALCPQLRIAQPALHIPYHALSAQRRRALTKQAQPKDPFSLYIPRSGETQVGGVIATSESAIYSKDSSVTHVLVGIPEDVGIRANGGRAGAFSTPHSVMSALLKFQSNRFFDASCLGWAGMVPVDDIMHQATNLTYPQDVEALCDLTAQVDQLVVNKLLPILNAAKVPVLIGGGHNNSYGALAACSLARGHAVNAINLDPHPDCRSLEGRHSGNGFSYAAQNRYLNKYAVLGMYETAANSYSLGMLDSNPAWMYETFESWGVRGETTMDSAADRCFEHVGDDNGFGLEIDTDGIVGCPSSAQTATGWTWDATRRLAHRAGRMKDCLYLHVCETAVSQAAVNDQPSIAKAVANIVVDFVRGHSMR